MAILKILGGCSPPPPPTGHGPYAYKVISAERKTVKPDGVRKGFIIAYMTYSMGINFLYAEITPLELESTTYSSYQIANKTISKSFEMVIEL